MLFTGLGMLYVNSVQDSKYYKAYTFQGKDSLRFNTKDNYSTCKLIISSSDIQGAMSCSVDVNKLNLLYTTW